MNTNRITLCPLTSRVVNPVLATDEHWTSYPAICLLTPFTIIVDVVSLAPRCIIGTVKSQ